MSVRDQRNFVDFGPWQHELFAAASTRLHVDFWQALTGQSDVRPDIRQAAVFRAMGMLNGAAKTLIPVLRANGQSDARPEFLRIQNEFFWRETLQTGVASHWRTRVVNSLAGTPLQERFGSLSGRRSRAEAVAGSPEFSAASVAAYCAGRPDLAAKLITQNSPDSLFARHSLQWQAGDVELADGTLKRLQTEHPNHRMTLAAEFERGIHQPQ